MVICKGVKFNLYSIGVVIVVGVLNLFVFLMRKVNVYLIIINWVMWLLFIWLSFCFKVFSVLVIFIFLNRNIVLLMIVRGVNVSNILFMMLVWIIVSDCLFC